MSLLRVGVRLLAEEGHDDQAGDATKMSRNDVAYAVDCWKFWYFASTTKVAVWVRPAMLPETILTAPNSPSDRARLSTTP